MRSSQFGERLKNKQAALGIPTQRDMAAMLGISESHLSLIYAGKRRPSGELLMRIHDFWPDIFSGDGGAGDEITNPDGK